MTSVDAKRAVRRRHPAAIVRAETVRRMVPVENLETRAINLRPECFPGYVVYGSPRAKNPLGHGRTESDAWLDCLS